MRVSRFFIDAPLSSGQNLSLPPHLINYIVNVLRLKSGDEVILFNGQKETEANSQSGEYTAVLTEVTKRHSTALIKNFIAKNTESPLKIHLFQGISRGERMDFTIQKAVELGVSEISPVYTQRSNLGNLNTKRLEKKMMHWQGVATSACEQSGRTAIVKINKPLKVEIIQHFNASINLLLSPDAHSNISELPDLSPGTVNIFIGPEGGLNNDEIGWATSNGYQQLRLGKRVLRTETAGLSILSILQYLWGDLG